MERDKEENLMMTYQVFMEIGLGAEDLGRLPALVDERIFGIGTAVDEKIYGIPDVEKLIENQKKQSTGLDMSWKQAPICRYITEDENTAVFADEIYLTIRAGEEIMEMYLRFSVVLYYVNGHWKVIHWHGSKPEQVESDKDTWGVYSWKQRAQELERLVEEKTADLVIKNRELEIEAALEKVRSRALAMHSSRELTDVVTVLFEKLSELNIPVSAVGIAVYIEGSKDYHAYVCAQIEGRVAISRYRVPYFNHRIANELYEAREKGLDFFTGHYSKEEKDSFYEYVIEHSELKRELPDDIRQFIFQSPSYTLSALLTRHAMININDFEGKSLSVDDIDVLRRFSHVFDQAYTRFLDLQKAEAQAREAQIEAALERVRARTMGMQRSEELQDVVHTLLEKLKELNVEFYTAIIILFSEDSKDIVWWLENKEKQHYARIRVPYADIAYLRDLFGARENGSNHFSTTYSFKDKNVLFHHLFSDTDFRSVPEQQRKFLLETEAATMSVAMAKNTGIHLTRYSDKAFSEEDNAILKRFAKVFEQTYTRFLDLQRVEAQAREAQVEAALEKIRSRSLSMQKSDEMRFVMEELLERLRELDMDFDAAFIIEFKSESLDIWSAYAAGTVGVTTIPAGGHEVTYFRDIFRAKNAEAPFFSHQYAFDEKNRFLDYLFQETNFQEIPDERKQYLYQADCYTVSIGFARHTAIQLHSYSRPAFSEHENEILRRVVNVFDQAHTRFLDLQNAEAQAREALVEAALERVRARSMAMHSSEELSDCAEMLFRELSALGGSLWSSGFAILEDDDQGEGEYRTTDQHGSREEVTYIPHQWDPTMRHLYEGWKQGQTYIRIDLEGDEIRQHYANMLALPKSGQVFQAVVDAGFDFPEWQQMHAACFKQGYLLVISLDNYDDSDLLIRFARVFEQTYTRFLDLKKAESQAREAQIEAALERVRARTMGMHKSEELKEVIKVVLEQFVQLKINVGHSGFYMDYKANDDMHIWLADPNLEPFYATLPYFDTPTWNSFLDAKAGGKNFHTDLLDFEEKNKFYRSLFQFFEVPEDARKFYLECKGLAVSTVLLDNVGLYIENFDGIPYSEEENAILMRFGNVFQQTYTRFLDLKKAEEQARETQVELCLERVRAHVTSMTKSSDLFDIVVNMRKEFVSLGHQADYFWHMRWLPDAYEMAMTSDDGSRIGMMIRIPKFVHEGIPELSRWEKGNDPLYVLALDPEGAWSYVDSMNTYGQYELVDPNAPTREDIRHIGGLTFVMARTTHGEIGFGLPGMVPHPPGEALETLIRFAGVFDLAYKRFEDLRTAEAQARTARIEAALERVRARALAMQQPEELREIAQVLRHEMGLLGVEELETSTVFLHDAGSEQAECWFAIRKGTDAEDNLVSDHIALHLPLTWVGRQMADFFASEDMRISIPMRGPDRREWIEYCYAQSLVLDGFYGEHIPDRVYHLYKFSNGAIGAAAPDDISSESWDLLQRTASVFSLAYARFRDLTQARIDLEKLRDEKQRAESALAELRAAQAQLVQSEKMASLGELTAGIAHEIQNPLNFVNNFAEVSQELADELKDEIARGNMSDAVTVADDIRQNLEKILHHGKRADAIVKGMLQHSRSSTGTKEPTDLNALADEYLRLAYHGLRAKDKSFNATFRADLDPALPKVGVVPQDIGRVLLNLINNAFYAVSEKQRQGGKEYEPTVTVRTLVAGDTIQIHVTDNGSGIPESVREKIFQPFFTTKPTGQGTGLGLSLAYDIVTKGHRGDLLVSTQEGLGTEFTIVLPVNG